MTEFSLAGRALADLGAQVARLQRENADLRDRVEAYTEAIVSIRPTAAGHDCPWCAEWDGETHGGDCILATLVEAA